jgi:GNAT superfamily N-acetyltransferase
MVRVIIRPAVADDAAGIIKLLTLQYDTTYPWPTFYDEKLLRQIIESLDPVIFVADMDSLLAGMIGLKTDSDFPGALEYTLLVVNTLYRRLGLGRTLINTITREALKSKALNLSLLGHVVTFNTISQRELLHLGLLPVGLVPQRFCVYNGDTHSLQRHTHLVMCRPVQKRITERLFIPQELDSHIYSLYRSLGVTVGDFPSGVKDVFKVNSFPESGYYEFFGGMPNLTAQSVTVFVNMTEDDCPQRYARLKDLGFVYTGLQPLLSGREYLIMHKADNLSDLFRDIKTIPEFESLRKFITEHLNLILILAIMYN